MSDEQAKRDAITSGSDPLAEFETQPTLRLLREKLPDALLEVSGAYGDLSLRLRPDALLQAGELLKTAPELDYDYLMDIAGVDYLGEKPRFEVVYHFYSLQHGHRLRLKVRVPEDDPTLDSLTGLWKSADWFEREAFDMVGIHFRGHPRLERILTHPEFIGHPLRKDYPSDRRHPLSRSYDLFDPPPPVVEDTD